MAFIQETRDTPYGTLHFFVMGGAMGVRLDDKLVTHAPMPVTGTDNQVKARLISFIDDTLRNLDSLMATAAREMLNEANKATTESVWLQLKAQRLRETSRRLTQVQKDRLAERKGKSR